MQETRWESKEPSKKESASLDLELRRHRMSGPSAVRRKSIVRTFLGAARGLWSTPRPGKGACSAATLEPAIHVLAPTDVDAFVHGWRVSAHLEHRQLLEEARPGPDLLAGCGSKKQRLALGVGAVRWMGALLTPSDGVEGVCRADSARVHHWLHSDREKEGTTSDFPDRDGRTERNERARHAQYEAIMVALRESP